MTHTLDPDDWSSFRTLAHEMIDDMVDHLSTIGERPAWQPMPDDVRSSFREPLPQTGDGAESAYREFVERVLPYPNGNSHPRFWGGCRGAASAGGDRRHARAAAQPAHGRLQSRARARRASGDCVARGADRFSARRERRPRPRRNDGEHHRPRGRASRQSRIRRSTRRIAVRHPRLLLYGSTETHGWAVKAAELLGLGSSSFRRMPIDADYRIDVAVLRDADRARSRGGTIARSGHRHRGNGQHRRDRRSPCACRSPRRALWFHVDGAFGALAALSEAACARWWPARASRLDRLRPAQVGAISRSTPPPPGARPGGASAHLRHAASYLAERHAGSTPGDCHSSTVGPDLSRGFRGARRPGSRFKAYGADRRPPPSSRTSARRRHLARACASEPMFELLLRWRSTSSASVTSAVPESQRNAVNEELLLRIQERGIAVPSGTVLAGPLRHPGRDHQPPQPHRRLRRADGGGDRDRTGAFGRGDSTSTLIGADVPPDVSGLATATSIVSAAATVVAGGSGGQLLFARVLRRCR